MRTITRLAVVDAPKCTGCSICVRICPVTAISLIKIGEKRMIAEVDEQKCVDCTLCVVRCPTYALSMEQRETPMEIGTSVASVPEEAVTRICEAAHMYPDQVVCYCHRVQAKEIAAAILQGAETPEDVALATGARTGCGTLCMTGVIRVMRAAGIELSKAPGYQWYGIHASIWDTTPELRAKYAQYYVEEDLREVNELYPGGKEDE